MFQVRKRQPISFYDETVSILGDEILGEIFLSVLLQCSRLQFKLRLYNASFLDDTWMLPHYMKLEFVPCKILGICAWYVCVCVREREREREKECARARVLIAVWF